MSASDALVVFTPSGRRGRFEHGTTVLEAARRLGVDLDSVCGGRGICGRCQIEVAEGEHAKHGDLVVAHGLSPVADVERAYAADRGLADGRRLGCTACVVGDVVIDVPPESQLYRQVVRKEADAHPIEIDPVVRLYYVEVEGAELGEAAGAVRRLNDALAREWELDGLAADHHVLPDLQPALARRSRRGHRRRPRRLDDHRGLARPPRRLVRDRVRRRLDHRRRPPLRPGHRRGARLRRVR